MVRDALLNARRAEPRHRSAGAGAGRRKRPAGSEASSSWPHEFAPEDAKGYGDFADLLSTHWEYPHELASPSRQGFAMARANTGSVMVDYDSMADSWDDRMIYQASSAQNSAAPVSWHLSDVKPMFTDDHLGQMGSFSYALGMSRGGSHTMGTGSAMMMTGSHLTNTMAQGRSIAPLGRGQSVRNLAMSRTLTEAGAPAVPPAGITSIGVGQELRDMLSDMNVKVESISMSEGMQAMLALAREGPTNDCAQQREKADEWEAQANSAESAADAGEGANPKQDTPKRPTSPLQPGVYASNVDRDWRVADDVRGLPNRGRDMSFSQERPQILSSRGASRGGQRGALPGRPGSSDPADCLTSREASRGGQRGAWQGRPGSSGTADAEIRPMMVSVSTLQRQRGRPQRTTLQEQALKQEHDHLAEERREYAAWKRKVIDCARLLDLEANRFRTET